MKVLPDMQPVLLGKLERRRPGVCQSRRPGSQVFLYLFMVLLMVLVLKAARFPGNTSNGTCTQVLCQSRQPGSRVLLTSFLQVMILVLKCWYWYWNEGKECAVVLLVIKCWYWTEEGMVDFWYTYLLVPEQAARTFPDGTLLISVFVVLVYCPDTSFFLQILWF